MKKTIVFFILLMTFSIVVQSEQHETIFDNPQDLTKEHVDTATSQEQIDIILNERPDLIGDLTAEQMSLASDDSIDKISELGYINYFKDKYPDPPQLYGLNNKEKRLWLRFNPNVHQNVVDQEGIEVGQNNFKTASGQQIKGLESFGEIRSDKDGNLVVTSKDGKVTIDLLDEDSIVKIEEGNIIVEKGQFNFHATEEDSVLLNNEDGFTKIGNCNGDMSCIRLVDKEVINEETGEIENRKVLDVVALNNDNIKVRSNSRENIDITGIPTNQKLLAKRAIDMIVQTEVAKKLHPEWITKEVKEGVTKERFSGHINYFEIEQFKKDNPNDYKLIVDDTTKKVYEAYAKKYGGKVEYVETPIKINRVKTSNKKYQLIEPHHGKAIVGPEGKTEFTKEEAENLFPMANEMFEFGGVEIKEVQEPENALDDIKDIDKYIEEKKPETGKLPEIKKEFSTLDKIVTSQPIHIETSNEEYKTNAEFIAPPNQNGFSEAHNIILTRKAAEVLAQNEMAEKINRPYLIGTYVKTEDLEDGRVKATVYINSNFISLYSDEELKLLGITTEK
jgi:hypothetical protein